MATTLDSYITQSPEVAGGKPHIEGRRITVQQIAFWHELQGQSADEIAHLYQLSLAEIHAALAYYYDHRQEIEARSHEDDIFVESLQQRISSKVALPSLHT